METRDLLTIPQVAKVLGLSRIAVYKKVKAGEIQAQRYGRVYLIPASYIKNLTGKALSQEAKAEIEKAVRKTVNEYGEVLKMLGKE